MQDKSLVGCTDADDKLFSFKPFLTTLICRGQNNKNQTATKSKSFMSNDSSPRWIDLLPSPFYAFYAWQLQQCLPTAAVSALLVQTNALWTSTVLGTRILFPHPALQKLPESVLLIADVTKERIHVQPFCNSGLLLSNVLESSISHTLS